MSSAVILENSSSPSYVGEAPHTENQLVAMCMIYALLNQAMGEGVKTQMDVGTSLSTAQDKVRDTLDTLNTNMATLKGEIQSLQDTISTLGPYLTAFAVASMVLGVGAVVAGPLLACFGVATMSTVAAVVSLGAQALGALAAMAGGAVSVVEGYATLKQSACSSELAPVNANITLASGAQKNYQATSKMVMGQIAESMSRITNLAQSIAKDIRTINEGLREANQNVLQGVLGNYK